MNTNLKGIRSSIKNRYYVNVLSQILLEEFDSRFRGNWILEFI